MAGSDFVSDLPLLSYKSMAWIWSMEGVCTMWLSEVGTFAMFWGLKIHSMTETNILWYDLRDYVCWFWCNARIFSPSVLWASLTSIMNYPLCMTHDLATVNRHDHAWTDNWAQNICKLSKLLTLRWLGYGRWQRGYRDHLYVTKGAWINYPTSCALLDVGFIFILRRTDIFILIWACTAVLPYATTVIFQIIQALNQNYYVV